LLAGGTQNLLFRFEREGRCYVLRRPSLTPRPEAERTILREARVLGALARTAVPHPKLIGACDSQAVLGAFFYVTEEVQGFNATLRLPDHFKADASARRRLGLELVEGIASLAAVDPDQLGLGDFGKPQGFLERQVPRWAAQLESYRQFPGWPGPAVLDRVADIGGWLERHRPASCVVGLMHGDYHIGNVLFNQGDGRLAAILDWELATLGDPLLDLARLLSSWPAPNGASPLSLKVEPWDGFPGREELIERYAQRTGRDLRDLLWFEVLACYKLAIVLEGTHARASAGLADSGTALRLHASAKALLGRAHDAIAQRG
jgi:aminoglycoside phosphotransferase (APT) family kinase protein